MKPTFASRRGVLRGAAAGSAAALAGLSGCSLLEDGTDANGDSGSSVPYKTWVPGSDVLPQPGANSVTSFGFDRLREHASELSADLSGFVTTNLERFQRWETNQDGIAGFSTITGTTGIYHGSFDASSLASSMRSTDAFEDAGTYEGYETMTERRTGLQWAVGDDAVVYARDTERLQTLLDTHLGEGSRAVDETQFGTVVDAIGGGTMVTISKSPEPISIRPQKPSGRIVTGERIRVEGSTTTFKFVYLLNREPTDADASSLRATIEKRRVSDVSVSRTDNRLTASGSFQTAELTRDILLYPQRAVLLFPLPGDKEQVLSDDVAE